MRWDRKPSRLLICAAAMRGGLALCSWLPGRSYRRPGAVPTLAAGGTAALVGADFASFTGSTDSSVVCWVTRPALVSGAQVAGSSLRPGARMRIRARPSSEPPSNNQQPEFFYRVTGIFASHRQQTDGVRRSLCGKENGEMRRIQVKKIVKREPTRPEPLPLDPRDADVVRAKQRLYERKTRPAPSDR